MILRFRLTSIIWVLYTKLMYDANVAIDMTLTAPGCSLADFIVEDVRLRVEGLECVKSATVNLVFEPEWNKDMMTEEAKLELGLE